MTIFTSPSLKVVLSLATAVAVHVSVSPPQPPAPLKRSTGQDLFNNIIRSVALVTKFLIFTDATATILTTYAPMHRTAYLCPYPSKSSAFSLSSVHPLFLLGTLLAVSCAALRKWCYITLRRHFTFEVCLLPHHELVTAGPYAWIRHPSYTGVHMVLFGATAVLGSRGAWASECGVLTTSGRGSSDRGAITIWAWLIAVFWVVKCSYAMGSALRRVEVKDRELKRNFGQVWEDYARRVKWVLIPGVY